MAGIPKPTPCHLDSLPKWRVIDGHQVWASPDGSRLFTWDSLHGEIEIFTRRGNHLGALDAVTGRLIKEAKKGRSLNVR
jgi:hypothetical protein